MTDDNLLPTTNELKEKRLNTKTDQDKHQQAVTHSAHVVVVSVHVIVVCEVIPSVAHNKLQASACDEQLVSIGGEIAPSGTPPPAAWKSPLR